MARFVAMMWAMRVVSTRVLPVPRAREHENRPVERFNCCALSGLRPSSRGASVRGREHARKSSGGAEPQLARCDRANRTEADRRRARRCSGDDPALEFDVALPATIPAKHDGQSRGSKSPTPENGGPALCRKDRELTSPAFGLSHLISGELAAPISRSSGTLSAASWGMIRQYRG